jgi:hypothetical protein
MDVLLIGNDQSIQVSGLQDQNTGDYLDSATVTVTIKNPDGTAVSGGTWPLTLDYVTSSNGNYLGIIEDGVALIERRAYTIEVTADDGSGRIGFWKFTRFAIYREP